MLTINKTIQGLWIGSELSIVEILCIRSFLFHGHEFHLYAYDPIKNIPDGTIVKDANEILPHSSVYRKRDGSLSSFANFFRWCLLKKTGGIWVDMDVICLKPFDFVDDIVFAWESEKYIATGVMKFPVGHPMTNVMMKACEDVNLFQPIDRNRTIIKKIARKIIFGKERSRIYTVFTEPGGPWYFTRFAKHYDMDHFAKPKEWFYALPFARWKDAFTPNSAVEGLISESFSVHLWNSAYFRSGIDKDKFSLDGTLVGMLRDRYL